MIEDKLKEIAKNLRTSLCYGSDLPENDCVFDEIYAAIEEAYNLSKDKINDLEYELWEEKKKSAEYKSGYDKIIISRRAADKLLQELKDDGIIKSWYFNGSYHWEK